MIHKYKMFEQSIVLDVYSGSVHVFDDTAFEVLDYFENFSRNEIVDKLADRFSKNDIEEAYDEIDNLRQAGLLFSEDSYADIVPMINNSSCIKAACFHISHDCNLRCTYCFASGGNFGGERVNMSFDVGKRAIDFLIEKSGNRRNLEVDFFGGEPLINFEVVKQIVEYARSIEEKNNKNFRFTITTNALMLDDEKIRYINENMSNVVLSIDGRQSTNDLMRKRINGDSSYDAVLSKIRKLVDEREHKNYFVRGTFTNKNLDFSKDVLHLADLGFGELSVEPVVAPDGSGYEITEKDLDVIFSEYEKLAYEYHIRKKENRGFNFFHFLLDLSQGPCVAKRLKGCGTGQEYISVTPDGDIFPCHQFVGISEFKMGNVINGELDTKIQNIFKDANIYSKKECRECFAKFYCSGGCAANAYQYNNSVNNVYEISCKMQRKRVECTLWLKANE